MNKKTRIAVILAAILCFGLGAGLIAISNAQQGGSYSNPIQANISVADAGTCSTTNSFAWQHLPSTAGITTLNLAGTFTATVTVRESNNGGATWTTITTLAVAGTTTYGTNGFTDFCADVTAFTSGTVQVSISTGIQSNVVGGGSALAGGAGANQQVLFNTNGAIGSANTVFTNAFGGPNPVTLTIGRGAVAQGQLALLNAGQTASFFVQSSAGLGTNITFDAVNFTATTPTTPVASTQIASAAQAPAGVYRVDYYSVVTTTGVGGTNFILNFLYTDAQAAQTVAAFTNTTFTAGNVNQGSFIIQQQAANTINYTITETGTFTTHPVLALKLSVYRIN